MDKNIQITIDGLMAENRGLFETLKQLDPESEDYGKVRNQIAQNAVTIADLEAKVTDNELKKKELVIKGLGVVATIGGVALEIFLKTKATNSVLDRIYGYETEALMPQNKIQMATKLLTEKTRL